MFLIVYAAMFFSEWGQNRILSEFQRLPIKVKLIMKYTGVKINRCISKPLKDLSLQRKYFLKYGFCVLSPVQFVVYVDAQVLVLIHNVHLCSIGGEGLRTGPLLPKVHHQLLRLCDVELQVV